MNHRRGSVIIYFIGLAAIVVIFAFAFLRSLVADVNAGDAGTKVALAQAAARQGLNHAIEEIVRDEAAASLVVGAGAGGTATIGNPPTFLDGPFRAQFVSVRRPNEVHNVDYYGGEADIDASNEHLVLKPLFPLSVNEYYKWYDYGLSVYDGRGRYIEANHHNLTRPAPTGSPPVARLDFTDLAAPAPERDQGLYLDSNFRRMDTGNAATDRATARYRLRYVLGVTDLSGQLLSNPEPEFNDNREDPANEYRIPPSHIARAQHGWYNLVSAFAPPPRFSDQANAVAGLRAEQVFIGRGNASNVDRQVGTGKPVTFPMMFRMRRGPANGNDTYWGAYGLANQFPTDETDGLYESAGTPASAAGGVPMAPMPGTPNPDTPFISTMFGPQLSWRNHFYSVTGWYGFNADGVSGNRALGRREDMLMITPFGRGLRAGVGTPASRVDCPWHVNLLTAPPNVLNAMIWAYLPNSVKTLKYTRESYQKYLGPNAFGQDTWGPIMATNVIPEQNRSIHGRDLFTRLCSAAFTAYLPPSTPGVDPNFQIYTSVSVVGSTTYGVRAEPRGPEARYPGKLWNGSSSVAGQCDDDLGLRIDTNTRFTKHGLCSHTRVPLLADLGGEITFWRREGNPLGSPPAGWGSSDKDSFTWSVDPVIYKFNDSYWWDVLKAFSTAAAFTRAQWVQYPTTTFDPNAGFAPASLRDPAANASMENFDRLFLRQLGENFDTPGVPGAMQPSYVQNANWDGFNQSWVVGPAANHNIRSLLDGDLLAENGQTSIERSKVMEMVLNDFRLSFFGADPAYSAAFRPKDFNGDGKVQCSAYAANAAASPEELANGTTQWKPVASADAIDTWFSLTGCFFIGKSHHYRVIARGELWDNMLRKPVSGVTLESVVVVDPEGAGQGRTHIPYQRWHFNRYTGDLTLQEE